MIPLYILINEFSKLGLVKSELSLIEHKSELTYNVSESIPFMATNIFYVKEIFPVVRSHQNKTYFKGWSEEDNIFFEKFLCTHTKMYF